ncbi:hypothetical protein SAMN05216366_12136 [Selenomonas ruminantium]|uniref:Uncharacterized protein n=1 Tax=Selenomonas ruminantium TaxID=971 RepID=A0A1H0T4R6_SELRU|nr:hypothetical protein SAMN05216366_12136 [Selenomonas ruminantium]
MNIAYAAQSSCRRHRGESQQGMVSLVLLCMLFILLFLGRGLLSFARQEAENIRQYSLETQLRLSAEGALESSWKRLDEYDVQLEKLQDGDKISLAQGRAGDFETYTYVIAQNKKMYLVAVAFRRVSDWEKKMEPHVRLKAEIKRIKARDGKIYYQWLGWTA